MCFMLGGTQECNSKWYKDLKQRSVIVKHPQYFNALKEKEHITEMNYKTNSNYY